MTTYPLRALMVGALRPLGARGVPSGIAKSPVASPIALGATGLAGDAQGDGRHHGGVEKAVHHYPFDHYAAWRNEIGAEALLANPGAFGENFSTLSLTEQAAAIGDVFAIGSAIIEISQGRQPCWKLNDRFSKPSMARSVQTSGRTGWYYRVLEPGLVSPSDSLELIERRSQEWTVARIWRAFYIDPLNLDELEGIADLPRLAESWRTHARRRLQTRTVEDWNRRLEGEG